MKRTWVTEITKSLPEGKRNCTICKKIKNLDEFQKRKNGRKGRLNICNLCLSASLSANRKVRLETERKHKKNAVKRIGIKAWRARMYRTSLWFRYRITPEERKQMIKDQNEKCICGKKFTTDKGTQRTPLIHFPQERQFLGQQA